MCFLSVGNHSLHPSTLNLCISSPQFRQQLIVGGPSSKNSFPSSRQNNPKFSTTVVRPNKRISISLSIIQIYSLGSTKSTNQNTISTHYLSEKNLTLTHSQVSLSEVILYYRNS